MRAQTETRGPPAPAQLTKRTGWVRNNVRLPESVADHSYRMGLMALLVQGTSYDYNRCAAWRMQGPAGTVVLPSRADCGWQRRRCSRQTAP